MLREIKNNHCNPYWQSFSFTSTTAPSATTNIGVGDVTTLTRPGAGQVVPTLKMPYSSAAIMAVTAGITSPIASAGHIAAAQTTTTLVPGMHSGAGAAIDGGYEVFAFGWRSLDRSSAMPQRILSTKERERVIWGKISGSTGAVQIGNSDFTCTKPSTGVFNITFKRAFSRAPIIQITGIFAAVSGNRIGRVTAKTASSCSVEFASRVPAVDDPTSFYVIVSGVDSAEEDCRQFAPINSTQRKPRIVAGRVAYSGGTPSIAIGTGDFTIVDTAVGQCTITLTKPFAREFAVCGAVRTGSRFNLETSNTASVMVVDCIATVSGALADPTSFDFIAIGSDDLTEY
jgi:hypothetical protein